MRRLVEPAALPPASDSVALSYAECGIFLCNRQKFRIPGFGGSTDSQCSVAKCTYAIGDSAGTVIAAVRRGPVERDSMANMNISAATSAGWFERYLRGGPVRSRGMES